VYAGWGWWLAGAPEDADGGLIAFRLGGRDADDSDDAGEGEDAGDGEDGEGAARGDDDPAAGDGAAGEDVYAQSCASCHGGTGEGGSGPSLVGVDDRLTRAEHLDVVRDGRGDMPGWDDDLTAEEIEAVVDYQRTVLARGDG
jgi:mono/diheme cytochrome c family protein